MFIADLFGNPIYPDCDRPDDGPGNGPSDRELALVVRAGQIPLLELLAACGFEAAPIIARLQADGTLDDDLNPVARSIAPAGPRKRRNCRRRCCQSLRGNTDNAADRSEARAINRRVADRRCITALSHIEDAPRALRLAA